MLNIIFFYVFEYYSDDYEVIINTKGDKVFVFEKNQSAKLGLDTINLVKKPEIVKELCDQQIIDICNGCYHVLALTASGKCFSLGCNNYEQLESWKAYIIDQN